MQSTRQIRSDEIAKAIDMAIEALSANATIAKIKIDDIDKAKTSSQLLDDLAVDMVKAMGKRIVEVVRCKDCRHRDLFSCPLADNDFQKDDDYCSWGERSEDANTD